MLRLRLISGFAVVLALAIAPQAPGSAPGPAPAGAPSGSVTHRGLRIGGQLRTYRLFVPTKLPRRAGLLVALHGGGSRESGERMASTVGFDAEAAARGFIVLYPDAVGGRFNGGQCCNRRADDVRFIDELVARLGDRFRLDRRRIFAAGFSNGGFMAYRLACERAATFAAIAVVAATEVVDRCRPSRPVSVLHIHARNDPKVPYHGGRFGSPSIPGLMREWRRRDRCRTFVESRPSEDLVKQRCSCAEGTVVQLIASATSGHSWPGAAAPYGVPEQPAFSATAAIWRFLDERRRA